MAVKLDEIWSACEGKKHIYIYGAGKNAGQMYCFLEHNQVKVQGFVVSDLSGNPKELFGRSVVDVDSFSDEEEFLIFVPVWRVSRAYREIFACLIRRQIHNVYFLSAEMLEYIKKEDLSYRKERLFGTGMYFLRKDVPVEAGHNVFAMRGGGNEEYHWRFSQKMLDKPIPDFACDMFAGRSALEEFEEQYGKYHVLQGRTPAAGDENASYAVYMARSHVDRAVLPGELPSWVIPIQVGAALTDEDIAGVKDNTGDHISERNGNYSECTAIYWMWKNAPKTDYIGLCHYRRHFDLEEAGIFELGQREIDVLVTSPSFVYETVKAFFSDMAPKEDMDVLLDVIEERRPQYRSSANAFFASRFYPPCNLFVMKYDLFMEYCEFLFSVTFGIEDYYNRIGFHRTDRYMGYLVECLLGIFLMKNKERLKIAYTDMRFYI